MSSYRWLRASSSWTLTCENGGEATFRLELAFAFAKLRWKSNCCECTSCSCSFCSFPRPVRARSDSGGDKLVSSERRAITEAGEYAFVACTFVVSGVLPPISFVLSCFGCNRDIAEMGGNAQQVNSVLFPLW